MYSVTIILGKNDYRYCHGKDRDNDPVAACLVPHFADVVVGVDQPLVDTLRPIANRLKI